MLTESEKEELFSKHQGIVRYIANRYRYFDELEDVLGWGYIGFVKAINKFEKRKDLSFQVIAFPMVKAEILNHYRGTNFSYEEKSLDEGVHDDDESGASLGDFIESEEFTYSMDDISSMFEEALFEQTDVKKNVTIDHFLNDKSAEYLSKEYNLKVTQVRRMYRRGKGLVKQYLVNNGIIIENVANPSEEVKKKEGVINHREIKSDEYGKMKYLLKYFSDLSINDLAILLETSTYMITQLLSYRSATYYSTPLDDSIKRRATRYYKKKYPERIAGPIREYRVVKIDEINLQTS